MFDEDDQTGILSLVVGGRFGLVIEGVGIDSIDTLHKVLEQLDVDSLEKSVAL